MKFLCLAYEEQRTFDTMSQPEWEAVRRETMDYVDKLRREGRLLDARPLRSATTAATVRVRDGHVAVTDGPFAETKEQIGGYFLLEADSLDDAVRLAADWPGARLGTIEVRPVDEALRSDGRYATLAEGGANVDG